MNIPVENQGEYLINNLSEWIIRQCCDNTLAGFSNVVRL